jgi:DNA-binding response OmpR family regulator
MQDAALRTARMPDARALSSVRLRQPLALESAASAPRPRAAASVAYGGAVALFAEQGNDEVDEALQLLGASTVRCGLFEHPEAAVGSRYNANARTERATPPRALIFDGGSRPDLAVRALRALRMHAGYTFVPALLVLPERQVASLVPGHGFEDFLVKPFFATDLYARLRHLEWRASEFLSDEHVKLGALHLDRNAREVRVDGRAVALTAQEYKLLTFFAVNLGKVVSRTQILAQVWAADYDGGAKTVDIHIRRLRMKLGSHFALQTRRGHGYVLPAPGNLTSQMDAANESFAAPLTGGKSR